MGREGREVSDMKFEFLLIPQKVINYKAKHLTDPKVSIVVSKSISVAFPLAVESHTIVLTSHNYLKYYSTKRTKPWASTYTKKWGDKIGKLLVRKT